MSVESDCKAPHASARWIEEVSQALGKPFEYTDQESCLDDDIASYYFDKGTWALLVNLMRSQRNEGYFEVSIDRGKKPDLSRRLKRAKVIVYDHPEAYMKKIDILSTEGVVIASIFATGQYDLTREKSS